MSLATLSSLGRIGRRSSCGLIGVDIGRRSVKLAQVSLSNRDYRLERAVRIPIPESAALTAASLRTGWLEEALRRQFRYGGQFHGRQAACVLSMSVSELRSIELPPGSEEDRRAMIAQELTDSEAANPEAAEFDFWNPDDQGGADLSPSTANVLSVASSLTVAVAEQLQRAGLFCRILDGGPFAVARSVRLDPALNEATEPIGLLDWGHDAALLVIARNGYPAFTRQLKGCGVGQVVDAVTQRLGLSTEEACQVLSEVGLSPMLGDPNAPIELQGMLSEFASAALRPLTAELLKTLGFLRLQRPELLPATIALTGGGAAVRQIAEALAPEVGVPIARWQPSLGEGGAGLSQQQPLEIFAQAAAVSALEWEP